MTTGAELEGVYSYGQGLVKKLVSIKGESPGTCISLITGVGNQSTTVFTPISKVLWICLGYTYDFQIYEGLDLGSIKINLSELTDKFESLSMIAVGFLSLAHKYEQEKYTVEYCKRDFGLEITKVN